MYRFLLLVFIAVPIVNFGAPLFPGGEQQFADYGTSRVDAAAYAFSIWAVIFIGMVGLTIDFASGNEVDSPQLRRATFGLILAGLASIGFVPISIHSSDLAVWLNILAHLLALTAAVYFLRRHVQLHPSARAGRWLFFAPSLYLGWISAATVISTAAMLREADVSFSGEIATGAACGSLVLVTAIAMWLAWRNDPFYGGTIVWALVAVAVQQSSFPMVRNTAWCAAALLATWIAVTTFRPPRFYAVTSAAPIEQPN